MQHTRTNTNSKTVAQQILHPPTSHHKQHLTLTHAEVVNNQNLALTPPPPKTSRPLPYHKELPYLLTHPTTLSYRCGNLTRFLDPIIQRIRRAHTHPNPLGSPNFPRLLKTLFITTHPYHTLRIWRISKCTRHIHYSRDNIRIYIILNIHISPPILSQPDLENILRRGTPPHIMDNPPPLWPPIHTPRPSTCTIPLRNMAQRT